MLRRGGNIASFIVHSFEQDGRNNIQRSLGTLVMRGLRNRKYITTHGKAD